MKISTFEMVANQLAIAEEADQYERLLYTAKNFLTESWAGVDEPVGKAFATIMSRIHHKRLEALANAALWALETTPAQQKEVKRRAYKAFFRRGLSISHLFPGLDNIYPTSFGVDDEKELRQWLDEVMDETGVKSNGA
jgi:hypothetical protein